MELAPEAGEGQGERDLPAPEPEPEPAEPKPAEPEPAEPEPAEPAPAPEPTPRCDEPLRSCPPGVDPCRDGAGCRIRLDNFHCMQYWHPPLEQAAGAS